MCTKDPVGAFVFVELLVGGFDEAGGGPAVFRVDADADADADSRLALIRTQAVLDAAGALLGHALVRVDHHDSKLVAAITHSEVGGAAVFVHDGGQTLEGAISRKVAVEIVDAFQAVEIQQKQAEGMMAAVGAADFMLEAVHKFAVVGQAGEGVMAGLIDGLLFVFLARGNVHSRAEAAGDFS